MKTRCSVLVLGFLAASLAGCADLSPELLTTTERPVDVFDVNMAVTNNQNWHMMWDDLGRVFYTDHPSRLSPLPILYTSGRPR